MVPCSIMTTLKLSVYTTCIISSMTVTLDNLTMEKNETYQSREETITQLNEAYGMCTHEKNVIASPNEANGMCTCEQNVIASPNEAIE